MLTHLFRNDIPQLDVLQATDRRCTVIVHEFVKGVELHHPQEELAWRVSQHFEMLNAIWTSGETVIWNQLTKKYIFLLSGYRLLQIDTGFLIGVTRFGFRIGRRSRRKELNVKFYDKIFAGDKIIWSPCILGESNSNHLVCQFCKQVF